MHGIANDWDAHHLGLPFRTHGWIFSGASPGSCQPSLRVERLQSEGVTFLRDSLRTAVGWTPLGGVPWPQLQASPANSKCEALGCGRYEGLEATLFP